MASDYNKPLSSPFLTKTVKVIAVALHVDAVAGSSLKLCYTLVFNLLFFSPLITETLMSYGRNTLINFGKESVGIGLSAVDLDAISINGICKPASQTSGTQYQCKQCGSPKKRGKRADIKAKLNKLGPKAVSLPSLLLAYVCSRENKIDEIRLRLTQ